MRKIPVSDPYIVEGEMEQFQKVEAELRAYQIKHAKMGHPKIEPYLDRRGWAAVGEGGYLRRKLPTSDRLFEEEFRSFEGRPSLLRPCQLTQVKAIIQRKEG